MINEQKTINILRNLDSNSIYYLKILSVDKIKDYSDDGDKTIEDRLINGDIKEDEIEEMLDNYLILWIEEFKTFNSPGKVLYAIDRIDLLRRMIELSLLGINDTDKSNQQEQSDSRNEESGIFWEGPYKLDIMDDLINVLKDDSDLIIKLDKLNLSISGFTDGEKIIFKLIDRDDTELASIIIPADANEVVKYMKLSLFKEQIKSVVNKKES